jgi:hypothetical protein
MDASVVGAGIAAAVAVETGQGVKAARLELTAQDILCHGSI